VATVLTQVQVDPDDPAFGREGKLVGPVLAPVDADRMRRERGWVMEPVGAGSGFRRVVPSPEPLAIVELSTIHRLVSAGVVVVCTGGGGIPVRCDADGALSGVEAVIDKDRSAALLASLLDADLLVYLTDVPAVASDWGSAFARPIGRVSVADLRGYRFEEATMGPKVESACRFVLQTGRRAAIGAVAEAAALCAGTAGTQIVAYEFDPALVSGVPGGAASALPAEAAVCAAGTGVGVDLDEIARLELPAAVTACAEQPRAAGGLHGPEVFTPAPEAPAGDRVPLPWTHGGSTSQGLAHRDLLGGTLDRLL
jgi:hypothetical protein